MFSPDTPHTKRLLDRAAAAGLSPVEAMVRVLRRALDASPEHAPRRTLLAVCPNSETVTRAALLAAQEANAPLLFAATLNQVDRNGGYTGWTPATFAAFVRKEVDRLDIDVPIVLGLDHGGPWKKDAHAQAELPFEETMAEVKRSLEACIDAGYGLLHLDPTVDLRLPPHTPVATETIVERTVELLAFAEETRQARGHPPIAYEVGTEETGGGLQSEERFADFIDQLAEALKTHDLPRSSFVVGDIGTRLDTAHVNPARAQRLTQVAQRVGALIKGHYTDGVADLEVYPLNGVGGANVGPGLAAEEYAALLELVRLEDRLNRSSGLRSALREAVIQSGRWEKWRRPEEEGAAFDDLPAERQDWLVETGSRYVWTEAEVQAARQRLYANVAPYRDAKAFVTWRVKTAILRYFHAFNLIGFNEALLEQLPALQP